MGKINLLKEADILIRKLKSGELENLSKLIDINSKLSQIKDYSPLIVSDLYGNPVIISSKKNAN